ncbi:MAG: hypothetical protein UT24_C0020G0011 [Candidatus Woesebacteria bacterium GW2011_GWB1_39_12]|uniref:Uncharacterized protein n=1 Tax=Candidatus Woesebacteria bacterium GW2011_GWB1_39_12 TaxID=1618574 RepID=A0A0G0M719_9BACT|nr:MAG: hypothetical protein UT24_C0020G0011 [Candidatus Woesebacteria bacterium GW2011_GWB1_39_12]
MPDKIVEKTEEQENITISKTALDKILLKIERLESAASKEALGNFDKKNQKKFGKNARVNLWDDKIIVGWRLTKDIVEKAPLTGVWREDQRIRLCFLDEKEESEEIEYVTFSRRYHSLPVSIKKEIKSFEKVNGEEVERMIFTVETKENTPRTFDIDSRFIN